jgi:hypothetical protein
VSAADLNRLPPAEFSVADSAEPTEAWWTSCFCAAPDARHLRAEAEQG